jgi:hypothetical protein
MRNLFVLLLIFQTGIRLAAQTGQSTFKQVYISKIPKPTAPANLQITDISFSDGKGNSNNILDANESAEIIFTLANSGKGDAYGMVVKIQDGNKVEGIKYLAEEPFGDLAPGKKSVIKIPLAANMKLESGKASFNIQVKEGNGFDADPINITFITQKFKNPQLVIVDNNFTNSEAEGKVKLGQIINLKLILQNLGQGESSDINVSFKNPFNVFPAGQTDFSFKKINPNESKIINYEFFANKQYDKAEISIQAIITESYGRYGEVKTMTVSLDQTLAQTRQINISAEPESQVKITENSLFSDVDKNIPRNNTSYENRYALIIGNEDYSSYQPGLDTEANVEFARNDAKMFKQYCENTLGVPFGNITYLTDATAGKMRQGTDKINKLIKNTDGKAEIFFYYAGHGLPDEKTLDSYLIPVDVSGNDLQNAIKLSSVYNSLTEFPAEKVTVFLDACFSGGARNQPLVSARSIKVVPKGDLLKGNIVVFAASSGEQTSLPYREKQHGMFTYFLLKELQETNGMVTYRELAEYLKKHVNLESVKINSKEQNPQTNISNEVKDAFEKWKM